MVCQVCVCVYIFWLLCVFVRLFWHLLCHIFLLLYDCVFVYFIFSKIHRFFTVLLFYLNYCLSELKVLFPAAMCSLKILCTP